jgi:hypothetical protein
MGPSLEQSDGDLLQIMSCQTGDRYGKKLDNDVQESFSKRANWFFTLSPL